MKKQLIALLSVFTVLAGIAHAELNNPGGIGGLESLRGATEIEATRAADSMKKYPR
ncbi:periplasmic nitrate reductase electron transfer subunit, partial [Vibrio cholerae]|nr:periplasmic nitrate reductase electron transfer subunit [Vibrio cholerae]